MVPVMGEDGVVINIEDWDNEDEEDNDRWSNSNSCIPSKCPVSLKAYSILDRPR